MNNLPPHNKSGLSITVDSSYRKTSINVPYKKKLNKVLYIPTFSVSDITWLGASYCVKKFFYTVSNKISLPQIFTNNGAYNFVPVLWWIDDNDEVQRRKLWHDDDLTLYCDVYGGELLPLQFAIEIWPLHEETVVTLETQIEILTSILVAPGTSCFTDVAQTLANSTFVGTDFIYDLVTYPWNCSEGDYWINKEPFIYFGATEFVDAVVDPPATLNPPTDVYFAPVCSGGYLVWTDTNGGAADYEIKVDALDSEIVDPSPAYYFSDITDSGTVYKIRANDGVNVSTWVTFTISSTTPDAPGAFAFGSEVPEQAEVTWTYVTDPDYFQILIYGHPGGECSIEETGDIFGSGPDDIYPLYLIPGSARTTHVLSVYIDNTEFYDALVKIRAIKDGKASAFATNELTSSFK